MIGRESADWQAMKRWLLAEIALTQAALESPTCGVKESDIVRGKLVAYRHIIATVEPQAVSMDIPASPRGSNY